MCLDSEVLSKSLFTFDTRFCEFTVWEKRFKVRIDFKIRVLCNIAVGTFLVAFVDVPEAETTVWIESLKPAWKVDDYCRVQWAEDQVIYESQIKSIDSAVGQR